MRFFKKSKKKQIKNSNILDFAFYQLIATNMKVVLLSFFVAKFLLLLKHFTLNSSKTYQFGLDTDSGAKSLFTTLEAVNLAF